MNTTLAMDFEQLCKEMINEAEHLLSWEWDNRFLAALSTFPTEEKETVVSIIDKTCPCQWDAATVGNAPKLVQAMADYLGGIMAGQQLFSCPVDDQVIALIALWPWGNGQTISIRILPVLSQYKESEVEGFLIQFKDWFNI